MAATFEPTAGADRSAEAGGSPRCARMPAGVAPSLDAREVVVSRLLDAPRELVFKAWSEPRLLLRWWAPTDCVALFCRVDLRPGGAFHYCVRERTGRDSWGIGTYREIVA